MDCWKVREARARFGELLEDAKTKGMQIISRRGVKEAVLVGIEEWEHLKRGDRASLKEILLAPYARTDNLVPERGSLRSRTLPR